MLRQLIWCPLDWIKNCLNYNEDFLKFVGRFINFAARQYDWRFSDTKQANLSGRKSVKPDKENLEPHQPSTINHQPPSLYTIISLRFFPCKELVRCTPWSLIDFSQFEFTISTNPSIHPFSLSVRSYVMINLRYEKTSKRWQLPFFFGLHPNNIDNNNTFICCLKVFSFLREIIMSVTKQMSVTTL